MKNLYPKIAGGVADGDVKNGSGAAAKADGAAGRRNFGVNGVDLAGNGIGDLREVEAVFVAEGEIGEQVGDGDNAALFEDGGALRADASEIFHGVGKLNRHRS